MIVTYQQLNDLPKRQYRVTLDMAVGVRSAPDQITDQEIADWIRRGADIDFSQYLRVERFEIADNSDVYCLREFEINTER